MNSQNHGKSAQAVFPFSGRLMDGKSASSWLIASVASATADVTLCSAFLRSEALSRLYPSIRKPCGGKILTRWRLGDLLTGASDLDAYVIARRLGYSFYTRQDFHGKVYAVPEDGVMVGSANATMSGFGLIDESNAEICTLVPYTQENQGLLNELFDDAVEITDALFTKISAIVQASSLGSANDLKWPDGLLDVHRSGVFNGRLLHSECFASAPVIDQNGNMFISDQRDLNLLGLYGVTLTADNVSRAFKATRVFRWLFAQIKISGGEMYFGSLASNLHATLLEDPVVYRRDVKIILHTLLQWCQCVRGLGISVDRPNHSQRIFMN